jgi:KipI family sensor histidine kinase inhibitor
MTMRKTTRDRLVSVEMVRAGDSAILVRLGTDISMAINAQVIALMRALDRHPPAGLRDMAPAYASLLVLFDPLATSSSAMMAHVRAVLSLMRMDVRAKNGKLVRIPVRYGGLDGPDLADVAKETGLSPAEVVRRHAGTEYHVYFLGFQGGFPYLGPVPAELVVPRLASPRPVVPAGSVGVAGQQTGVYPVAAPGGWRVIGRTSLLLFDPARHPPSLLHPGDRVRFEPVNEAPVSGSERPRPVYATTRASSQASSSALSRRVGGVHAAEAATDEPSVPWVQIHRPGPLTTVQDLGRPGFARYGISASGAADVDALRVGNLLLGNAPGAAALEITLGDTELEILTSCLAAFTGAESEITLNNDVPLLPRVATPLRPHDRLHIGVARWGVRGYVCVAGGVHVAPVLGSCATDVRAGLGGVAGRALRAGDMLARGMTAVPRTGSPGGYSPLLDPTRHLPRDGTWVVRVLPGPHAQELTADIAVLLSSVYTVSVQADRVGVRLKTHHPAHAQGTCGGEMAGEVLSEGIPRGAIQVPPDGEPIILLADHQTTGGYRVPLVVATADHWRVAQLRPGTRVRFAPITVEDAVAALCTRAEWLCRLAAAREHSICEPPLPGMSPEGLLDLAQLMRGFAEWYEDEVLDE